MNSADQIRARFPASLEEIYECNACSLCEKSYPIRSRGNFKSQAMMLGEAPGKIEEEQDVFFQGPAGELLQEVGEKINLNIDEHFLIHNVVICRPHPPEGVRKENRPPTKEEIAACRPNLEKVIGVHQPKLIVVIGGVAASAILNNYSGRVGSIVGQFSGPDSHNLNCNADIYSIWHPAYILRNNNKKKEWIMSLIKLRDYMFGRNFIDQKLE